MALILRRSWRVSCASTFHRWSAICKSSQVQTFRSNRGFSVSRNRNHQDPVFTQQQSLVSKQPISTKPTPIGQHNREKDTSSTYNIEERPLGNLSPLRVIVVGSGVSGINVLQSLKHKSAKISFVAYEKNCKIGGTWFENRYPGCASDDPCHTYQYPDFPNPNWSSLYAPAREIEQYLQNFVDKHELTSSIKCGQKVIHARWDEDTGTWVVKLKDDSGNVFEDRGHVLIDATGIFNEWKWPNITGLHSFKGDLMHIADWTEGFKYRDKVIALIGNGASGVQLVPELQKDVKALHHFIRSKTWITPTSDASKLCEAYMNGQPKAPATNFGTGIDLNSLDYSTYNKFVRELCTLAAKERFRSAIQSSEEAEATRKSATEYMTTSLSQLPNLAASLIPSFPVGCRRITPSTSYLSSLLAANMSVYTDPICEVLPTGIVLNNGGHVAIDAIICATGFNTSFIPRFPILGVGGRNLQDLWNEENGGGPKAYMSCMAEDMPNYFRFFGPNGPLAHGPIPLLTSHLCEYILKHIRKMQIEHLSSIRPSRSAVRDFNEHVQTFMPRTVWAGKGCGGWYKGKGKKDGTEGTVTALHPGSQGHWVSMLRDVRWEDFEFGKRTGNRFSYLGNGFTVEECEEQNDGVEEPNNVSVRHTLSPGGGLQKNRGEGCHQKDR